MDVEWNSSGIYKIVNKIDGKFYLGSASIFRKRRNLHFAQLKRNMHGNPYLQAAWNKYGEENFDFVKILIVHDKSKLEEVEQYFLDHTNCYDSDIGYNICKSANQSRLGLKSSAEHVEKIRVAITGSKRSSESCARIGLAKKGTVLSEERKQARRDYRHTEDTKRLISLVQLGRTHTPESIQTMSIVKKYKNMYRKFKANPWALLLYPHVNVSVFDDGR